jgi:hypothetical protein
VGAEGKVSKMGPGKVYLPLSAFFLQMSGMMDGDGGEDMIVGVRRKKGSKKDKKKRASAKKKDDTNTPQGPKDQTHGGSGAGDDAIGKDATAGAAPKAESLKIHWKKLPAPPGKPFETTGYEAKTSMGKVTLTKRKKRWIMKVGKHEIDLGRKASFDRAEGELLRISKLDERVQTSAQEAIVTLGLGGAKLGPVAGSGGKRYARMMALTNVGGDGSCKKCGSEPGTNIDCKRCMASKTEMTTAGSVGGVTKQGATHASTGGVMGSGNVPVAPVPIGTPLRRVAPVGKKKRKKKRKKREEWSRMMAMVAING